jgi:hypothetical protein
LSFTLRAFENRVLRRMFGPKRDKVTKKCRKVQNEELNSSTPNIVQVIKLRIMCEILNDVKLISCLLTTDKAHFHPSGYINEQKIPINSASDL